MHVAASFLPVWILSLEAATSTLSVTTSRSYKDTSPSVHFMLPVLLQLSAVWSDRQTHATSTVAAECCGKADHRNQTSRTHHIDIASTLLAAGQTTSWIRDCHPGIYTKCCQAKYLPIWLTILISPHKVLLAPSASSSGSVWRKCILTPNTIFFNSNLRNLTPLMSSISTTVNLLVV